MSRSGALGILLGILLLAGCDTAPPTVAQLDPLPGARLTSKFGARPRDPVSGRISASGHHDGYDLAARAGAPIRATKSGKVVFAGRAGGYGNLVILDHPGGWQTRYGHASRLAVKAGQWVRAGAVVAYVGSTGHSTGPHLHYELRLRGVPVDPELTRAAYAAGRAAKPRGRVIARRATINPRSATIGTARARHGALSADLPVTRGFHQDGQNRRSVLSWHYQHHPDPLEPDAAAAHRRGHPSS